MYLTKEEFKILKCFKEGMTRKEIQEKYGIKLYTNDPRITALFEKYGVTKISELVAKANIDRVDVVSKENIPYFEYDTINLVKRIPIQRRNIEKLLEIFQSNPNFNKNDFYELQYSFDGLGSNLYICDKQNNKYWI